MGNHEKRREIYNIFEEYKIFCALKEYRKKYNADFYCVILTPKEGQKVRVPESFRGNSATGGKYGVIIEGVVKKEVFNNLPLKTK